MGVRRERGFWHLGFATFPVVAATFKAPGGFYAAETFYRLAKIGNLVIK